MAQHGDELAAVILEPISYDAGAILPDKAFLDLVRAETARRGIVLIFDEVLSGYRTGPTCAQGYLGVTPDLTILGKAIGGGVPLSVFGGKRELMRMVAPIGLQQSSSTSPPQVRPYFSIRNGGCWRAIAICTSRETLAFTGGRRRDSTAVSGVGVVSFTSCSPTATSRSSLFTRGTSNGST